MLERKPLNTDNAPHQEAENAAREYTGGSFIPLKSLAVSADRPRLDLAAVREKMADKKGSAYWRSLEEACETPEFTRYLGREFPHQAPRDMLPLGRRDFMKLMGAALALAGVGGCAFQPPEHIVPYIKAPEGMEAGIPLYFTTAMTLGGYAYPLMAESNMGRPTKIEGNPEHPGSQGRTSAIAQAAVLSMYDPDRSQTARVGGDVANWTQFIGVLDGLMKSQVANRGAGLRVLSETVSSPTMAEMMSRLKTRFPQMQWVQYEPVNRDNVREGAILAFGQDAHPLYRFDRAQVVLSLDCDFLLEEPNQVMNARTFMKARKPQSGQMNRLYAAYSTPNITAATADHSLPLRASEIEQLARVLAERLGVAGATGDGKVGSNAAASAKWIDALVADLQAARGKGLVVVGSHQPPAVHALAHAINETLGNAGTTVEYSQPVVAQPSNQLNDLQRLTADMNAGRVQTLVIFGANPVFTAPSDLKIANALKKVPNTIHLGHYDDETGVQCKWHIPETHFLESWGDARSYDGTVTLQQPLILPLYEATHSPLEVLNVMVGLGDSNGHDILRAYWMEQRGGGAKNAAGATATGGATATSGASTRTPASGAPAGSAISAGAATMGVAAATAAKPGAATQNGNMSMQSEQSIAFDKTWQKFVHDGFVAGTAVKPQPMKVRGGFAASLPAAKSGAGLEVIFRPDPTIYDGRFANNGWLQELPKPLTKLTWDNAAMMSPATAAKLGFALLFQDEMSGHHEMATLTYKGQSVTAPVLVVPGHPDDSVTLHYGYGRERGGKTADGAGFNVYPLRQSAAPSFDNGLEVAKSDKKYRLALTAHHNIIDVNAGGAVNDPNKIDGTYGRDLVRVGTFDEMQKKNLPVAASDKRGLPIPLGAKGMFPHHEEDEATGENASEMEPNGFPSLYPQNPDVTQRYKNGGLDGPESRPHAWGMAIDLTSCIGCNACVIGCQSENNVSIVGKDQVLMNRQMQWIRIDAYYKGEIENPEVHFQPVTCMHCEKAPCEPVCPVNATVHSPEGLNEQIYNRCVGTKYCSNNCPYKVRRFNFLQYSDQDTPQIQLMHNPDVTVRSRGVMEKCNYCVQRIQEAKIQAEKEERPVREGDIVTACQQTCPTDAIVFGDTNDPNSQVRRIKDGALNYGLLTELNTVPRTTYQAKIVNTNARITPASEVVMYGESVEESHDSGGAESAVGDTRNQLESAP